MSRPHLAVIIPAYNEESRLRPTLERINEYLSRQTYTWVVAVIDDGSTDSTARIADLFAGDHPEFAVIKLESNQGKGAAVRTGMLALDATMLLFSDADLATPIEELEKLLPEIGRGADIAIGSRPLRESNLEIRQPLYREWLGRLFNKAVRLLAVRGIADTQCGFKVFTHAAARDVFSRCKLQKFGFDFEALMIARDLGLRIAEVPIRWRHQEGSKVRLLRDGTRMLADLVRLRLMGKKRRLEPHAD